MSTTYPVIAIDGPTASGKGTVAAMVAAALNFHYLDSGALYRLTAVALHRQGLSADDPAAAERTARTMNAAFVEGKVLLEGDDVTEALRSEAASQAASRVAAYPGVRAELLAAQRRACRAPGLVADGRDMGSTVFPTATLKVFLTASAQTRAERRTKQLISKGISAKMLDVLRELEERDERDRTREVAPLVCLPDALLLETDALTAQAAAAKVLEWFTVRFAEQVAQRGAQFQGYASSNDYDELAGRD